MALDGVTDLPDMLEPKENVGAAETASWGNVCLRGLSRARNRRENEFFTICTSFSDYILHSSAGLLVMARLAQRLPVSFVPEELRIAPMRQDVVDHRRGRQHTALQTDGA